MSESKLLVTCPFCHNTWETKQGQSNRHSIFCNYCRKCFHNPYFTGIVHVRTAFECGNCHLIINHMPSDSTKYIKCWRCQFNNPNPLYIKPQHKIEAVNDANNCNRISKSSAQQCGLLEKRDE